MRMTQGFPPFQWDSPGHLLAVCELDMRHTAAHPLHAECIAIIRLKQAFSRRTGLYGL